MPSSSDEGGCVKRDEFESLLPENDTLFVNDILILWKRRRLRGKNGGTLFPFQSLRENVTCIKKKPAHAENLSDPLHLHASAATIDRMEAGGGCNDENLRALELESHSRPLKKCDMADMDVMLSREKEREDLLYDIWLQSIYVLDDSEEPEFGYDNLGWYQTITKCDEGEDDGTEGEG